MRVRAKLCRTKQGLMRGTATVDKFVAAEAPYVHKFQSSSKDRLRHFYHESLRINKIPKIQIRFESGSGPGGWCRHSLTNPGIKEIDSLLIP